MRKKYLFLIALVVLSIPLFAFAAGLVPCGGPSESPCTLCGLYVLAQNIMDFLMWQTVPIIAIFAFSWAGFKILISGPNPGLRNEGFGIMKKTLVGMLIVFSSWIIINEVLLFFSSPTGATTGSVLSNPWNKVSCALRPSAAALPPGVTMGPAYDGPGAPNQQGLPRFTLANQGINAKTNYCTDFAPPNQTTACTTLVQLPQNAIDGLINLQSACNCTIFVTGGTEIIGHSNHGPDLAAVDVAMDANLTSYIYQQVGGAQNCGSQTVKGVSYQLCSANNINYLNEINHWHIHWL